MEMCLKLVVLVLIIVVLERRCFSGSLADVPPHLTNPSLNVVQVSDKTSSNPGNSASDINFNSGHDSTVSPPDSDVNPGVARDATTPASPSAFSNSTTTRICQSIDVRNKVSNLALLRGCRVVEGSVQIVLIDHANDTDYDDFSFPELHEITHYLLFYRVSGLRSAGQLFPSLSLIRGNAVFEDYALVVYEMFHLQEVGLSSLAEITRGAVRIEKNPSLCFLDTINWDLIAKWDSVKNYVAHNKNPADCPGVAVCLEAGCPLGLCWSSTDCQIQASDTYKNCSAQCLGGCSGPGPRACHSCRKYLTLNGECVSECPDGTYLHMNRRCVTKDHCLSLIDHQGDQSKSLKFVVFNGTCVQNCPPGYDFTQDGKGCEECEKGKCRKVCPGLSIDNIAAAQNLRGCTFINGSLEIAIKHGKHKILAQELEDSLQAVEEIKGYLKVIRCFPLVNLKFFRNLKVIHGDEPLLENGKYSLIVLDNQNLQELWDFTTNFKIMNGRIFFHYNPKLCFYYIESLITITGLTKTSNFEVAQESNGDKFACNMTKVEVKFLRVSSNSVLIHILLPNQTTPHPSLQRYVLYYTEATSNNMTVFEEADECNDDSWRVRDVLMEPGQQVFTIQTFLKPFTQYAFYVKTYTVHSMGGQSPIYYIRTLPSQPSEVSVTLAYSNSSSTIVLQWEPPRRINGVLSEYVVSGFWHRDDRTILDQRDYCQHPLVGETIEELPPDLLTWVENETTSCCPENKILYKPRGEFNRLCDNSEQKTLVFDRDEKDVGATCEKYFYDNIYESPLLPENSEEKGSITQQNKFVKREYHAETHETNSLNLKYQTQNSNQSWPETYTTFYEIVNTNTTSYLISNLHHFAKYTISVKACRERHITDTKKDNDKRCSQSEIVTVRTLQKPEADTIDSDKVLHKVLELQNNIALEIKWPEPEDPNGIVVTFEIEYRRRDLENGIATRECLTYVNYIKNGKKYHLQGLHPGKYTFRLRAVSLGGPSSFTPVFPFEIEKPISRFYYNFVVLIIVFLVIVSICVGYFFLRRRKNLLDLDVLVSSVNNEQYTTPPYLEDSWEIPRENVQILRELGQGSFGHVYEGILHPIKIPCAVKTVTNAAAAFSSAFLNETTVMKQAAGVHHIVQLLGVVTIGGPPLVVMELMASGDLKTYLRSSRNLPPFGSRALIMAAQIADAMLFMETYRFVHRDLAARNCLVQKDLTVKVGDFGLTRDVYLTDYYRKGDRGLLPIRWMAPESLRDGVFTSRSDVWSYGVVLWEIATLAELPYRGLSNEQVLRRVVDGETPSAPVFCPEPLKIVMDLCWNRNPARRPNFRQLVNKLEPYTDDVFRCVSYFHMTIPGERLNEGKKGTCQQSESGQDQVTLF